MLDYVLGTRMPCNITGWFCHFSSWYLERKTKTLGQRQYAKQRCQELCLNNVKYNEK